MQKETKVYRGNQKQAKDRQKKTKDNQQKATAREMNIHPDPPRRPNTMKTKMKCNRYTIARNDPTYLERDPELILAVS